MQSNMSIRCVGKCVGGCVLVAYDANFITLIIVPVNLIPSTPSDMGLYNYNNLLLLVVVVLVLVLLVIA